MAKRTTMSSDTVNRITAIDAADMSALRRLPVIDTTDEDFGAVFKKNPTAALAAKGIEISPKEAGKIKEQLAGIGAAGGPGGSNLSTEVAVSVKVKF